MRKLVLAAALSAAFPSLGTAAPCLPGSLADYIGLGSGGCTVGGATVAGFTSDAAPGAIEFDPASIFVTPLDGSPSTVGLSFQLVGAAASGEVKGNGIGYAISGPQLVSRLLMLGGSLVTPDGVVTAVQFAPDPLVVFDTGIDADLVSMAALAPTAFLQVLTEITLDGGQSGSAGLEVEVTDTFRIPEPASLALLGIALSALAWRYRRRRALA